MELRFKIGPAVISLVFDSPAESQIGELYEPFRYRGEEPSLLTVFIREGSLPTNQPKKWVAELEKSWRLFQGENFHELEILEQMKFEPRAVARIKRSWNEIDFYGTPPAWTVGSVIEPLVQWWLARWAARERKGFLLHGSAVAWNGCGLAFFGPSGAGKTTIARIFLEETGVEVLNDERIFLWRDEGRWRVSGTPWSGMLWKTSCRTVPLKGLFFLKKGPQNQIKSLPLLSMTSNLISESFLPLWDQEGMHGIAELSGAVIQEVPCAELEFLKDASVVRYLDEILNRSEAILL